MVKLVDRAMMTSPTTGTGSTIDLGAAVGGYRTLAAAGVVPGDLVSYVVEDGTAWEIGRATYSETPDDRLTGRTLIASSTGSLLALSGGARVFVTALAQDLAGPQDAFVWARDLTPQVTNGASRGLVELPTNRQMLETLDFDGVTQEFATVMLALPKRWAAGTISAIPYWTAALGSGTVVWQVEAVCRADDDALDVSYGAAQSSSDTLIAANGIHIGPETPAITVAGAARERLLLLRIKRDVATDTLAVDAKLIGLRLRYTADASNDA